jgi:hypothetical protein
MKVKTNIKAGRRNGTLPENHGGVEDHGGRRPR